MHGKLNNDLEINPRANHFRLLRYLQPLIPQIDRRQTVGFTVSIAEADIFYPRIKNSAPRSHRQNPFSKSPHNPTPFFLSSANSFPIPPFNFSRPKAKALYTSFFHFSPRNTNLVTRAIGGAPPHHTHTHSLYTSSAMLSQLFALGVVAATISRTAAQDAVPDPMPESAIAEGAPFNGTSNAVLIGPALSISHQVPGRSASRTTTPRSQMPSRPSRPSGRQRRSSRATRTRRRSGPRSSPAYLTSHPKHVSVFTLSTTSLIPHHTGNGPR